MAREYSARDIALMCEALRHMMPSGDPRNAEERLEKMLRARMLNGTDPDDLLADAVEFFGFPDDLKQTAKN